MLNHQLGENERIASADGDWLICLKLEGQRWLEPIGHVEDFATDSRTTDRVCTHPRAMNDRIRVAAAVAATARSIVALSGD